MASRTGVSCFEVSLTSTKSPTFALKLGMLTRRPFINHGHVKVNGRRVNIPSFKAKVGDLVEVKESSKQLTPVLEAIQLAERDVPDFLEVDHSKMTAKFARIPALSDVPFPVQMEPHLIVEFYSR